MRFRVLGCRGWGRADLMLRATASYSFLEMNTSPGMTGHSLVPMARQGGGHFLRAPVRADPGDARPMSGERTVERRAGRASLRIGGHRRSVAVLCGSLVRRAYAFARSSADRARGPGRRRPASHSRRRCWSNCAREQRKRQFLHASTSKRCAQAVREAALGARGDACGASWPDRLEVDVEEHVALARWNDAALVNTHGEVFAAD